MKCLPVVTSSHVSAMVTDMLLVYIWVCVGVCLCVNTKSAGLSTCEQTKCV